MPIFTFPLAFLAIAAVPTLLGIYWLRNKFRRHTVSSLMLWVDHRRPREGGLRRHRVQTPLLFFLEMLALLLIMIAATGPMLLGRQGGRPVVVVLDDSYSMLAGGKQTTRDIAAEALIRELRREGSYSVRLITAGATPQALGDPVKTVAQAERLLENWTCRSNSSCLDEATALAAALGGQRARIIVITDHPAVDLPEKGRIEWWSFGKSEPNFAFVNATRTNHDGQDRCLLEIANLSDKSASTILTIEGDGAAKPAKKTLIKLDAKQVHRLFLKLRTNAPPLRATLSDDALSIDNQAVLLPQPSRTVRVALSVKDEMLRELVTKALESTGDVRLTTSRPQLIVTDNADMLSPPGTTWILRIITEEDSSAYVGPFVLNREHPLTEGLTLDGVIWSAGKSENMAGTPVITAGNISLLTDTERMAGSHEIRLRIRPEMSTLQSSPNWPILLCNLVRWRASQLPGLHRSNFRLGSTVTFTMQSQGQEATLWTPDGQTRPLSVIDKVATVNVDQSGVYTVNAETRDYTFAANALHREESDLTECDSGRWGCKPDNATIAREYNSVAWIALLAALAVLTCHQTMVAMNRTGVKQ